MLTWASWESPLTGLYPTLRYNILFNFIPFVSFLCLIAFVKIIMFFPTGTFEHKPECVRLSCCVVSSEFGEITGCRRHPYMVACPACMGGTIRSAKHQLIKFRFYIAKSGVLTACSFCPEKSDACSRVAGTWNWSYSQFCDTSTSLEMQPKHLEPNAKGEGCTKVKAPFRLTQKLQECIGLIENPQGGAASNKHGLVALNVIC